ncbi:MAG: tetratricopeptide repeat protein [Verrucomicrobiota bacterium]
MAEQPESKETNEMPAVAESRGPGVVEVLEKNRNALLIALLLLAVAICGYFVYKQMADQKHMAAGQAYSDAAAKGDIASLDAVVVNHPGSVAAGNALLRKADILIDQGNNEDAIKTLEQFSSDFSAHPRSAQGPFGLANVYHKTGDAEKAKSLYEETISKDTAGDVAPLAMIRLGDLLMEAGDTEGAEQQYTATFDKAPSGSPFVDLADSRLNLLKVGTPPTVERPAPPAPVVSDDKKEEEPKKEEPKKEEPKKDAGAKPAKGKAEAKAKGAPAKAKEVADKAGQAVKKASTEGAKKADAVAKKAGDAVKAASKEGAKKTEAVAKKTGDTVKKAAAEVKKPAEVVKDAVKEAAKPAAE